MKKHVYLFDIVLDGYAVPRCKRAYASLENCIKKAIATCKAENARSFIIYNIETGSEIQLYVD